MWSRFRTRFVLLEACSDVSPNRRVESIDPDGFVHSRSGEPRVDLGFDARDDEADAVAAEISGKVPQAISPGRVDVGHSLSVEYQPAGGFRCAANGLERGPRT